MDIRNEPDIAALRNARAALRKNPIQAINELEALAARGSVASRIYLGRAFLDGTAGGVDLNASEKWFGSAAEQGSIYASYCLGRVYLQMRKYSQAEGAFKTAAKDNYPPALRMLGFMYIRGFTGSRDWIHAKELLERATAEGDFYAKGYLAGVLVHGPSWFVFRSPFRPREILRGLGLWFSGWLDLLLSSKRIKNLE